MADYKHILTDYVYTITDTLVGLGVENAVISPGSRSTPLAYAFSAHADMNTYIQIDERSAAFYALGMAKASGKSVVLLCTSGTAAANYFPAVVEANLARVPLIVITADRPPELREVGAPQTIKQTSLYGDHVKWSVDFPLADAYPETLSFVERHLNRAVTLASSMPHGPVQLNVPFREPLLIDFEKFQTAEKRSRTFVANELYSKEGVEQFEQVINNAQAGLIIAGDMPVQTPVDAFWEFAESLGWPILADPLSQLRTNIPANCEHLVIDQYDALLKSERFIQTIKHDVIIRFGAQPVSKPLTQFIKNHAFDQYVVMDESALYRDALHKSTLHLQLTPAVVWKPMDRVIENPMLSVWKEANTKAKQIVKRYKLHESDEGALAGVLFDSLQNESDLIASSSMPIRDVDTFFETTTKDIGVFANRGANGIDGVVSTAFGIQAARKRPAYLLIGDLAMLHDSNGLLLSKFQQTDLTIVVMNNNGGGIFSYLPQSTETVYFESLFGTPTNMTFNDLARMYDAQFDVVTSMNEMQKVLSKEKVKDVRIIEVMTNRQNNIEKHRELWKAVNDSL